MQREFLSRIIKPLNRLRDVPAPSGLVFKQGRGCLLLPCKPHRVTAMGLSSQPTTDLSDSSSSSSDKFQSSLSLKSWQMIPYLVSYCVHTTVGSLIEHAFPHPHPGSHSCPFEQLRSTTSPGCHARDTALSLSKTLLNKVHKC